MDSKTVILLFALLILLVLTFSSSICYAHRGHHHWFHHYRHRKPHRGGKPQHSRPRVPAPATTTTTTASTTTNIDKNGCGVCLPTINTRTIIAIGIWNTIAGGDCCWTTIGHGKGNSHPGYSVINVFDQNINTYYMNYGSGSNGVRTADSGINTGFYATLSIGECVVQGFQFTTAGDTPDRDPLEITIEGSNSPSSLLRFGSSWTLIYNGTSGLRVDPGRKQVASRQTFDNMISFHSYRVLVTRKRGIESSVQYAEFAFFGNCTTDKLIIHTLNDKPIAIWNARIGRDSSFTTVDTGQGHTIINIFDQNVNTYYMNIDSSLNTGFYITLNAGHCIVNGFRFSTSNGSADRDPLELTIEGSNAPTSALTLGRSWTYVSNGSTGLEFDCGRKIAGPLQIIDNIVPFNSYRILITKKRAINSIVQYSEVTLYGKCQTELHAIDTRNDKGIAIWKTIVGQDSSRTCVGEDQSQRYLDETVVNIFDQDVDTQYQNYGSNRKEMSTMNGGINTGFYVKLAVGYCLLKGFRFTTANGWPERDPIKVTIEGSNASSTLLTRGESWSMIYNGSSGLELDPGRLIPGYIQKVDTNSIFNSYRVLISKKRDIGSSVQYSEVTFYGECTTYDEEGYILNMSKTIFVNGLSSDSVVNIQLIDRNQIEIGILRAGDDLNITSTVKHINIAFRNNVPQLYSFTVNHNITDGFVTIHETNSYIFLTFLNDFGDEQVDLVKLTGSSSTYKHGAEISAWKRKFEQHRQSLLNAFTNLDFSIIKYRIASSLEKKLQIPITDVEQDAVSRINFINTNATIYYIDLVTNCKHEIIVLNNKKLENTIMKKRLINLKEITIRNISRIQEETHQFILQDLENFPYNVQDSAVDFFITNFQTSMDFIIKITELINRFPDQYETFFKISVPPKPCILV